MEHIKNIEIKNFKSIRHAEIKDCRRVNVFIGYPNVGKSNILEALGLFSIPLLKKSEYFRFDNICRVKHFSELYFNQNYREKISVGINKEFSLELDINQRNRLQLKFVTLTGLLSNIQKDFGGYLIYAVDQNDMIAKEQNDRSVLLNKKDNDARIPNYDIKRYLFLNDSSVNNVNSLELSVPYGNNLLDVLQREPTLRKDLAEILRFYGLKLLLDTSSGAIMLIKEIDDSTVLRIPYHQIADTLKRLIFFKAAIQTNLNSVLLFEEPEAHMFAPYISKFTSDLVSDENSNQYFIATHSPYVLNNLISDLDDTELAIYLVSYKKETGETVIDKMNKEEMHEAYQFGYDFFMNLENFIPQA